MSTQSQSSPGLSPGTAPRELLYVSSQGYPSSTAQYVEVYSYPKVDLKAQLTGLSSPQGSCVDRESDVFVPDADYNEIFKYRHGVAKPSAVLHDEPYASPADCAVDPTTGDLAVTNTFLGDVAVFPRARGKLKSYSNPNFYELLGAGYDDRGDLFVSGLDQQLEPFLAELPETGHDSGFIILTIPKLRRSVGLIGGVKWDGKYAVVGSASNGTVFQIRVHGTKGTIVGSVYLAISGSIWIPRSWGAKPGQQADRIIVAGGYQVKVFKYPAGSSPIKTLNVQDPSGVAVSPSKG